MKNIISERWECDVSLLSQVVPNGGTVDIVGHPYYDENGILRSVVENQGSTSRINSYDSVFVKRMRLYCPWIPFGARLVQGTEAVQMGILLDDGHTVHYPRPVEVSSFSALGEWVDVNLSIPKPSELVPALGLKIFSLVRACKIIFPTGMPAEVVGNHVYLSLQVELAHTLWAGEL